MAQRTRQLPYGKRILFSAATIFALLLVFEVILRIGEYVYFQTYAHLDFSDVQEDAFRILFLGESTTMGTGAGGERYAYPALVEQILKEKSPTSLVQCFNLGVGAIETTAILRNLDRHMIKYRPHLIILMAGLNDYFAGYVNRYEVTEPSRVKMVISKLKIYRLCSFFKDAIRIRADPTDGGGFRYVLENNIEGGKHDEIRFSEFSFLYKPLRYSLSEMLFHLRSIVHTIRSYGSDIWFAGYLEPTEQEKAHLGDLLNNIHKVNLIIQDAAKTDNVNYVGGYRTYHDESEQDLFADDGGHPSKAGHRLIAEKIVDVILREGLLTGAPPLQ